jgi:hypothetical protein
MEPSRHRMTAPDDPALLDRVTTELGRQGSPPVTVRKYVVLDFECATGDFMLRARVADALMSATDHDQWQRLFQPLD